MKFETTRQPNFIQIKGAESRIDIGLLTEKDFKVFAKEMQNKLREHYLKRKSMFLTGLGVTNETI